MRGAPGGRWTKLGFERRLRRSQSSPSSVAKSRPPIFQPRAFSIAGSADFLQHHPAAPVFQHVRGCRRLYPFPIFTRLTRQKVCWFGRRAVNRPVRLASDQFDEFVRNGRRSSVQPTLCKLDRFGKMSIVPFKSVYLPTRAAASLRQILRVPSRRLPPKGPVS